MNRTELQRLTAWSEWPDCEHPHAAQVVLYKQGPDLVITASDGVFTGELVISGAAVAEMRKCLYSGVELRIEIPSQVVDRTFTVILPATEGPPIPDP